MNKVEFFATKFLKECAEEKLTIAEIQEMVEAMIDVCRGQRLELRSKACKEIYAKPFEMPEGEIKARR